MLQKDLNIESSSKGRNKNLGFGGLFLNSTNQAEEVGTAGNILREGADVLEEGLEEVPVQLSLINPAQSVNNVSAKAETFRFSVDQTAASTEETYSIGGSELELELDISEGIDDYQISNFDDEGLRTLGSRVVNFSDDAIKGLGSRIRSFTDTGVLDLFKQEERSEEVKKLIRQEVERRGLEMAD